MSANQLNAVLCRKGPTAPSALLCLLGLAALWALLTAPCWAHGRTAPSNPGANGVSIPNLSHGQMSVISNNLNAILGAADLEYAPDPTTQKLQSFVSLQYFSCLRSWVPGSLTDEESPFNECTHAYLAGARALLMHLKTLPGRRPGIRALAAKIELEMLENNTSLVLCRYSDEPFNSAEVLSPHWSDIPSHPPSMAAFGSVVIVLVLSGFFLVRRRRAGPAGVIDPDAAKSV